MRETQTAATVDETIARLEKKKGIEGILIVGRDGKVIRSTAPDAATAKYALTLTKLVDGARTAVTDLDDKVRSRQHAPL